MPVSFCLSVCLFGVIGIINNTECALKRLLVARLQSRLSVKGEIGCIEALYALAGFSSSPQASSYEGSGHLKAVPGAPQHSPTSRGHL